MPADAFYASGLLGIIRAQTGTVPSNIEEAEFGRDSRQAANRTATAPLHRPLRVQLLPKSQEDVRHPGGDRQQAVHACVARCAQGDHQVWILDTGPVVDDNPFLAATDPTGMPVPLEEVLSIPSEAL